EKELMSTATFDDNESKREASMLHSTYSGVVMQHRSIFETLWNGAIPAADIINEIEKRSQELTQLRL
ncbi:MAG: hypothetical protein ACHQ1H_06880, partial [Nitrososphaerales archaeon]